MGERVCVVQMLPYIRRLERFESNDVDRERKYLRRSGGASIQAFEKMFPNSESPVRLTRLGRRDVSVLFNVYEPSSLA